MSKATPDGTQQLPLIDRHSAGGDNADRLRMTEVIVDQAPSALALLDSEGRLGYVNEAFRQITGYPEDEALAVPARELIAAAAEALNAGKTLREHEAICLGKDGSRIAVVASLTAQADGHSVLEFREASHIHDRERALTLVLKLGDTMRDLQDPGLIMGCATRALGEHLGVSHCAVAILNPDGETCRVECAWPHGGEQISQLRELSMSAIREGKTTVYDEARPGPGSGASILCPVVFRGRSVALVMLRHDQPRSWTDHEIELVEMVTRRCWAEIQRARADADRREAYEATLEGWSRTLDARDHESEGHSRRVAEMAVRLARRLEYPEDKMTHLETGALLHDIGKMGVPDDVLQKSGPLTEEEKEAIKRHPEIAMEMLASIEFLEPALEIPYVHHERWDGTGYPRGLKGEEIPLSARIFSVVDVYDALTSDRPYRPAWPAATALAYIDSQAGRHFDPDVAAAFVEMKLEELEQGTHSQE